MGKEEEEEETTEKKSFKGGGGGGGAATKARRELWSPPSPFPLAAAAALALCVRISSAEFATKTFSKKVQKNSKNSFPTNTESKNTFAFFSCG